jgi:hypothetical protein
MSLSVLDQVENAAAVRDGGLVTASKVATAVERIVEVAKPLRVVAFGSRARGDHRRESDLDLGVMIEGFDPKRDKPPVTRSDLDVWMSIDLLVYSRERHEFMKDSIISVHHCIASEGVTLYDAGTGSIDYGAIGRIAR